MSSIKNTVCPNCKGKKFSPAYPVSKRPCGFCSGKGFLTPEEIQTKMQMRKLLRDLHGVPDGSNQRPDQVKEYAAEIVDFLLEDEQMPTPTMRVPVQIESPDGNVIDAEFTGYYDNGAISIGYGPANNRTHGILKRDEKLLTHVPSQAVWRRWVERQYQHNLAAWNQRREQRASLPV